MRCFFIYLTLFLQLILKTSVFSITQLTHKTITNMKTLITALCLMLSFGYAYTQVILYTPCETNIVPIAEDSSDVFTEKEGLWLNKTLNPLYEQQVLKGGFLQIVRGQPTNYKYDFISKRVALFYGSLGNLLFPCVPVFASPPYWPQRVPCDLCWLNISVQFIRPLLQQRLVSSR